MATAIFCPHCKAAFNVADTNLGKRLRCMQCQDVFTAKAAPSPRMAGKPSGPRQSPVEEIIAEAELVDEVELPRRRRRADEEDEEDRPHKRSRAEEGKAKSGMPLGLIIGLSVGGGLLLIGGLLALIFLLSPGEDPEIAEIRRTKGDAAAEMAKKLKDQAKGLEADLKKNPSGTQPQAAGEVASPAQALEQLKSGDQFGKNQAITYLRRSEPTGPEQAEIASLLNSLYNSGHPSAGPALARWATAAQMPSLITLADPGISDPGNEQRNPALMTLGKLQDERGLDVILANLTTPAGINGTAKRALEQFGPKNRSGLIRNAFHKNSQTRSYIQTALEQQNVPASELIPQALKDLKSPEQEVRNAVSDWLVNTPPVAAEQPKVARALEDLLTDARKRDPALKALKTWADKDSLTPLIILWKQPNSPHDDIRPILVRLKEAKSVEVLAADLPNFFDRGKALDALQLVGPELGVKAVLPYLNHPDGGVNESVRKQLQAWSAKPEDLIGQCVKDLAANDVKIQQNALDFLGKAAPVDAQRADLLKAIEPLLIAPERGLKERAAGVFCAWSDKSSIPKLILLTNQNQGRIREQALNALARFKDNKEAQLAIANQVVVDGGDWRLACDLLKTMGPPAEQSVWEIFLTTNTNAWVEACNILAVIGTKESIKVMTAAAKRDPANLRLQVAGRQAIQAIKAR